MVAFPATLVPSLVAAIGSFALAAFLLKLWRADMNVPFFYQRDALANLMLVKNTLHQGWPIHNPLLGAPFGQDLYDFPVVAGDPMHLAIIKGIGVFSTNPALVANVFFLLQFPIIALTALWALRRLGLAVWPAVASAILYSLAPYHFYRGELHLFLAGYWSVPLGVYLVTRLLAGLPLVRPRGEPATGPTSPLSWSALVMVCFVIGTSDVYYAVLTLLLLGVALVASLLRPSWRTLAAHALIAMALIGVTVAAAHAPTILYHARHGQNAEIQKSRDPSQSEQYGMKLTRLILPVDDHRITPLAHLTRKYERDAPSQLDEGPPQALGTLATLGFIALLLAALAAAVPGQRRFVPMPLVAASAMVAVAAALLGVSGGLASAVSYLVSHAIRSWNRYSIFVEFAALVPVGLVLGRLGPAIASRRFGTLLWPALLVVVVVLGAFDQAGRSVVPKYKQIASQWHVETDFVHAVEATMPHGAEIYQTPYFPFPEWGYELARGYLHSNQLRWSFGAMEGRPADWSHALLDQSGRVILPSVASAGFDGFYVDRALYPDNGKAIDAQLTRQLGAPLVVSHGQRFELFDLRPYRARLSVKVGNAAMRRLGFLTLHPPRVVFGPQFGPDVPTAPTFALGNERSTTGPRGYVDLDNPLPVTRIAHLRVTFTSDIQAELVIGLPSGQIKKLSIGPGGTRFDQLVTLIPGSSRILLAVNIAANPRRKDYINLENFSLIDSATEQLALHASKAAS